MKFLLQVASTFTDAFNELLDVYEKIGEGVPFLLQYERLFTQDMNMQRVLVIIYKDILRFHHKALKYFQQPSMYPHRPFHGWMKWLSSNDSVETTVPGDLEDI